METTTTPVEQPAPKQAPGLSTTSFVLGIISFIPLVGVLLGVLAIIFGGIALRTIKKENIPAGKKRSIIGIVLGALGIAFTFAVYGSLFYFGFVAENGPFAEMRGELSEQMLTQDAGLLELYKNKHGVYPGSYDELREDGFQAMGFDHYMNEFHYEVSEDGLSYELRSLGQDGEYGTEDDVFPNTVTTTPND
ncbi:MAG: DUF4190 domain-containing protein [Bacteroidetes bacterium]|nr:MAG: DUF4190 domain-containing protein [Bacteroidota bacterium]